MNLQKTFSPILIAIVLLSLVGCQENENDPIKDNDSVHTLVVTDQDCKDIFAKPSTHRGEKVINHQRIQIIADKCLLRGKFKPSDNRSW